MGPGPAKKIKLRCGEARKPEMQHVAFQTLQNNAARVCATSPHIFPQSPRREVLHIWPAEIPSPQFCFFGRPRPQIRDRIHILKVLGRSAELRRALTEHSRPSCPCHCDTLAENFLAAGDRMWVSSQ